MSALLVSTPVEGFTGVVAGVAFEGGAALVDPGNRSALGYFRQAGYRIEPVLEQPVELTPEPVDPAPAKRAAKRAPRKGP